MDVWVVREASIEYNDNDYSVYPNGPLVGVFTDRRVAADTHRQCVDDVADGWDPKDIAGARDGDSVHDLVEAAAELEQFTVSDATDGEPLDEVWVVIDEYGTAVDAVYAHGPNAALHVRDHCTESAWTRWRITAYPLTGTDTEVTS